MALDIRACGQHRDHHRLLIMKAHDDLTFTEIGATMAYYDLTFNVIGATMAHDDLTFNVIGATIESASQNPPACLYKPRVCGNKAELLRRNPCRV